jgi:hypothetical protein
VLINVLAGKANPHQRLFGTGNMADVLKTMGWKQGKGGPHDVTVGFSTAKELQMTCGHTVGTLGGLNVEARGGKHGGVKVGPRGRSPFEKTFRHHRHLPVMAASTDLMQRLLLQANKDLRDPAANPGSKVPGGFPRKVPTMKP